MSGGLAGGGGGGGPGCGAGAPEREFLAGARSGSPYGAWSGVP